jgi:hypothetical protein
MTPNVIRWVTLIINRLNSMVLRFIGWITHVVHRLKSTIPNFTGWINHGHTAIFNQLSYVDAQKTKTSSATRVQTQPLVMTVMANSYALDDSGRQHHLSIPNTLLVQKGSLTSWLLSTQQNYKPGVDADIRGPDGRICGVDSTLSWVDHKFQMNTALSAGNSVSIINSTTGYSRFTALTNLAGQADEPGDPYRPPHLIPDNEQPSSRFLQHAGNTL